MGLVKTANCIFGETIVKEGFRDEKIFVLDSDVSRASYTYLFKENFPERFLNVGIAEQNMASIAAGLALKGYKPVITSLAKFISLRCLDQVVNSIAYPKLNVLMVGIYAGISIGKDGATHQTVEDIGVLKSIPNMSIINPCSHREVNELVGQSFKYQGPTYLRLTAGIPETQLSEEKIEFGKARVMTNGDQLTVVTTGVMTGKVLNVIKEEDLEEKVSLIHTHTIKPIDAESIRKSARKTLKVITIEDHNVIGGIGESVSSLLCNEEGVVVKIIGLNDVFGCSDDAEELYNKYNLCEESIKNYILQNISK
ncbi:transketolase family protein [Paramaledivibacter caminithermalis]|jgi:transketolase|uniref:Transketolase n=1 Tax=Paramaledivibacter caminithermalis (strain DSM 15212 / CIP 107654 / DViRD3) TaxID=1121301 RepID=A0A1M6SPC4_PARC5|nr:transketolase C-terminal domain-containing protein [Paramaledivibacter caminithermalis]SHK46553.1 transketolase [Paramaledivibacter caminithermalis DSM 15212]